MLFIQPDHFQSGRTCRPLSTRPNENMTTDRMASLQEPEQTKPARTEDKFQHTNQSPNLSLLHNELRPAVLQQALPQTVDTSLAHWQTIPTIVISAPDDKPPRLSQRSLWLPIMEAGITEKKACNPPAETAMLLNAAGPDPFVDTGLLLDKSSDGLFGFITINPIHTAACARRHMEQQKTFADQDHPTHL